MKNMNDDIVTLLMIMMMLVMMMINHGAGYYDGDDNKSNDIDGSLCQCCLFEEDGQVPRRPGLKRQ